MLATSSRIRAARILAGRAAQLRYLTRSRTNDGQSCPRAGTRSARTPSRLTTLTFYRSSRLVIRGSSDLVVALVIKQKVKQAHTLTKELLNDVGLSIFWLGDALVFSPQGISCSPPSR